MHWADWLLQTCQLIVYVIGCAPVHEPVVAVSFSPTTALPEIAGTDVRDASYEYLHKHVSTVFQAVGRHHATARERIAMGDILVFSNLRSTLQADGDPFEFQIGVKGKGFSFKALTTLTKRETEVVLAGGLTNCIREAH